MNRFKDFGIETQITTFIGDKIKINKVFDKEVKVHAHKIEPSKYPEKGNGKCLYLQIELKGTFYVVFTSSVYLQDMILRVAPDRYPFTTTIIEIGGGIFKFT